MEAFYQRTCPLAAAAATEGAATTAANADQKDPANFWSGYLTKLSAGYNARYKCMSCDLEFTGTTRAAVHLRARENDHTVRMCPNLEGKVDEVKEIKRQYEKTSREIKKLKSAPQGAQRAIGQRVVKFIGADIKPKVDELFARMIFMCSLPFMLVEKIWLRTWLHDGLGLVYSLPSRRTIAGPLLDAEYLRVQARVQKQLSSVHTYQLCSDGWSNIRGEAIISYVLTCRKGDYYLDSKDASLVQKKSSEWCLKDFERVLQLCEESKVVGFISDTEMKMRKLWSLIEEKYPTILAYGCTTHTLQLLLKDICGVGWFESVCARCNQIGKWFRNHHLPAGLLKKWSKKLLDAEFRPVRHCATRFASWVYVVERIQKLKGPLRAAVDDRVYQNHCLDKKGRDDDPEDKEPTAIIEDALFWLQVNKFLEVRTYKFFVSLPNQNLS